MNLEVFYYCLYLFALMQGVVVCVRHFFIFHKIKSEQVKMLRSLMVKQNISLFIFVLSNLIFALLAIFKTSYDWLIFPLATIGMIGYSYYTDKLIEFYKHG